MRFTPIFSIRKNAAIVPARAPPLSKEKIDAITTLIDPEIMLLAEHRAEFEAMGITVLAPYEDTARLCYNKYDFCRFLADHGINTPKTYGTVDDFMEAKASGEVDFPVFVKPRTGSGSVGARKIMGLDDLKEAFKNDPTLIVQELMVGRDLDADVYVDTVSQRPAAIFTKISFQRLLVVLIRLYRSRMRRCLTL